MQIIDNINLLLGDDLKAHLRPHTKLKIAASCFSIYAYEALKAELATIDALEFIFTAPTFTASSATDRIAKERREFYIPKINRELDLYGSEFEIQLRNKLSQRAIARECAEWIRRKALFKSNKTKSPMQAFATTQHAGDAVAYMPLNGFTAVDLGYQRSDAISNITNRFDEAPVAHTYLTLFDQIWHDTDKLEDVTHAIIDHIEAVYAENAPERIYFLMLYHIFHEFLADMSEDVLPNDRTGYQNTLIWQKLFNFQRDAAHGIINKLESYNGCILADSVGLGKTFTALAVIKYYELRNRSVLVLAPKKLADNWLNYNTNVVTNIFAKDRFNYDVLCHTDLSRDSGYSYNIPLNRINWGNYDLVVIDESHNFRNNDAYKEHETRYQRLMNKVIRSGVKTKVLMLSATPVNNRFVDLRNQLALAYEGESSQLSAKLHSKRSIDAIFQRAQAAFNVWSKLPAEQRTAKTILDTLDYDFFELLDSVTIARSRKHIEMFYDTRDIGQFPTRNKPLSYRAPLSHRADVLAFNEIFARLQALSLAVYAPISYVLPSRLKKYAERYDTSVSGGKGHLRQIDRERSLQALMTTNLLKRLESSVEAFRLTLTSLQQLHLRTLQSISAYQHQRTGSVEDITDIMAHLEGDDDDISDELANNIGTKIKINLADMDVPTWQRALQTDLSIINDLLDAMRLITPTDDAKLQHVLAHISHKITNPINPSNKKVLIFTAFADTANYLYQQLARTLQQRHGIHSGLVTGSDAPQSTVPRSLDFQGVLTLFAPHAKDKALTMPQVTHEIDLLIGTDCISEGQNLQDCDYVINYDIHWNPVRIIQRFGRVDRIGSRNQRIQLVNYWPDISLDEYIKLKERVENRMVIADVTATGDDNPLTSQSSDVSYRREQLRRLQEEVIELEDVKTGISITDLGLNDFRMDLLNYVKAHGELTNAPKGLHAVVPAQPERGLPPGVIFALRNRNQQLALTQHNRLHPYYLVYVDTHGHIVANHTEVKRLLDLVRSACKGADEPIAHVCRIFNQLSADGRHMQPYSDLLNTSIRSMIEVNADKDIDSLFSTGHTTALVERISGLDDFELIAFLVVQEVTV
jgi:superfamily II DNA or RNA helicase